MPVSVKTSGNTFEAGAKQPLFRLKRAASTASFDYAVANDGKRFLVLDPVSEERPKPIVVVVNWTADLKRQ